MNRKLEILSAKIVQGESFPTEQRKTPFYSYC